MGIALVYGLLGQGADLRENLRRAAETSPPLWAVGRFWSEQVLIGRRRAGQRVALLIHKTARSGLRPGQLGEAAIVDRAAGLGVGDGEQPARLVHELEPREAAGAECRDRQLDAAMDLRDQRARHRDRW